VRPLGGLFALATPNCTVHCPFLCEILIYESFLFSLCFTDESLSRLVSRAGLNEFVDILFNISF